MEIQEKMPSHYVMADIKILGQYKSTDLALRVAMLTSDRGSSYENEEELQNQYCENAN